MSQAADGARPRFKKLWRKTMRRSLILSTILAASVAVLGACDPKPEVPNKPPVATPSPVATASPVASPSVSPTGSPVKPGASPEVKKTDDQDGHKDVKPTSAETPKAK
jgi:hypothetical protein